MVPWFAGGDGRGFGHDLAAGAFVARGIADSYQLVSESDLVHGPAAGGAGLQRKVSYEFSNAIHRGGAAEGAASVSGDRARELRASSEHDKLGEAGGTREYKFTFRANVPGATNRWTAAPRGTVVLLHGYGLAQFSMAPWALRLGQEGWRCVLVDLRGHGKSTGRRIYFGMKEANDLTQLLDALAHDGQLREPVGVMGESYGAALALRWKTVDARVGQWWSAIAPYAVRCPMSW